MYVQYIYVLPILPYIFEGVSVGIFWEGLNLYAVKWPLGFTGSRVRGEGKGSEEMKVDSNNSLLNLVMLSSDMNR